MCFCASKLWLFIGETTLLPSATVRHTHAQRTPHDPTRVETIYSVLLSTTRDLLGIGCPLITIPYYHIESRIATTKTPKMSILSSFYIMHKKAGAWVLVIVQFSQIRPAGPGNKSLRNEFFKSPRNDFFNSPSPIPGVGFQYYQNLTSS